MKDKSLSSVDFTNTEIAFSGVSNKQLKKKAILFGLMNKPFLVQVGSKMGLLAFKLHLPVGFFVRKTIFELFCGGRNLKECQKTIDRLWSNKVLTILDYGAEAKSGEKAFDDTMNQTIKAIEFCYHNDSAPVVSTKISGLARIDLLEKIQLKKPLSGQEEKEYEKVVARIDKICKTAFEYGNTGVFIDAEESWIQDTIDDLATMMMERYNKEKVFVYNTYQLYRKDKLEHLKTAFDRAQEKGYLLGAKLVRGAYLDKENERAKRLNYPTPMQPDKASTDRDYNAALLFCVDRYEQLGMCNASHNDASNRYMVELIEERKLPRDHPHLNFCQLLGMSDHLSFNLAKGGFCVAKYVPYGPVRDVIPYLIRRAQENTSVTGDMSRELGFIRKELKRRGLK